MTSTAAAAVALLSLVAGGPLARLAWGDWPVTGLPSGGQIGGLPSTVASGSAIIAVFTVALWLAWALFVACVLVEAAADARGRAVAARAAGLSKFDAPNGAREYTFR